MCPFALTPYNFSKFLTEPFTFLKSHSYTKYKNLNFLEDIMPRQLRAIRQEVTYHCYSRCHDKKNLLHAKVSKQFFIVAIQMAQEI